MKAKLLLAKMKNQLVGRTIMTQPFGDWPGGLARVVEICPDHTAPEIVFNVTAWFWHHGPMGVFEYEEVELLPEQTAWPQFGPVVDQFIDDTIKYLNDLVGADRDAIERLVEYRVSCNDALVNHPLVQVQDHHGGTPVIGMLGVLNGMIGLQPEGQLHPGWGYIAAVFDDQTMKLTGFKRADQ